MLFLAVEIYFILFVILESKISLKRKSSIRIVVEYQNVLDALIHFQIFNRLRYVIETFLPNQLARLTLPYCHRLSSP